MSFGRSLDGSLDSSEEIRFRKKHSDLLQRMVKKLHFTHEELESILIIYYKMQRENHDKHAPISKDQIKEVLHNGFDMTDPVLTDRIFSAANRSGPYNSMETWLTAMSLLLRGTLEEKTSHSFAVYDAMSYGKLAKEGMFQLLKTSLISGLGEDEEAESVKDMLELLTKKMDVDRDGKISLNDFRTTVLQEPLLLETFGQTVTSRLAVNAFLTTFTHKVQKM